MPNSCVAEMTHDAGRQGVRAASQGRELTPRGLVVRRLVSERRCLTHQDLVGTYHQRIRVAPRHVEAFRSASASAVSAAVMPPY